MNTDPLTLHKYLYANGDPVNMLDPTGLLPEFNLTNILIAVAILAVLIAIVFVVVPLFRFGARFLSMSSATVLDEVDKETVIRTIKRYWGDVPRMRNFVNDLDGITVRVFPATTDAEGMHARFDINSVWVSENAVNQGDIALALVIFAEYQHHTLGGSLNEENAQAEFVVIRP